ncbi:MAG TPA: nitrilase-related carbon-nitrogen hydrolase [Acidimicrobiales bacterium]|nr:nitrilase-related carbon-nitrogen hydrolase [Acidimicrobiales bacterium]
MRILLASLVCKKGDLAANLAAHAAALRRARRSGCHLAVFPELSLTGSVDPVTGAVPIDHPAVGALLDAAQDARVGALFGLSERVGPDAFISQAYAVGGGIAGVQRKRRLGDDESAYAAADDTTLFRYGAATFAAVICAESGHPDVWDAAAGASALFLCAAPGLRRRLVTPGDWEDAFDWWTSTGLTDAQAEARRLGRWVAAVSQAGSAGDEDFPGGAAVISPTGDIVSALPDGQPGELVADLPVTVEVQPVRSAVRVLVVADDGRTLLVRFSDDSTGRQWWFPPGGGVEGGEDDASCARRELAEELGRGDLPLGPPIGHRSATFPVNGRWFSQAERWYVCRCPPFEVPSEVPALAAAEGIRELRWWSADELRAAAVDTAPRQLAGLVDAVVNGRLPDPSSDLGR